MFILSFFYCFSFCIIAKKSLPHSILCILCPVLYSKSFIVSDLTLLLSPRSWCTQDFVCALQESVSLVLWMFCNQIPLAFKVKFPGGSQPLCWIPRLGNLLWALELLQQYENSFGIAVSSLWVVCSVALWWGLQVMPPRSVAARAAVSTAAHC